DDDLVLDPLEARVTLVAKHQLVVEEEDRVSQLYLRHDQLEVRVRRELELDEGLRLHRFGAGLPQRFGLGGRGRATAGRTRQIGRDWHDHRRAHQHLAGIHAEGFHLQPDGPTQVDPGRHLYATGERQGADVEILLAHDLLQWRWHAYFVEFEVRGGNGNDGRIQRGLAHDLLHFLAQQAGHGHFFVDHQQQGLPDVVAGEEVELQGPRLGHIAAGEIGATAGFSQIGRA